MPDLPEPDDPFYELQHGGDQMGNLLNQGAILYRGLRDTDNIASVLRGVWALDKRDLRRLALSATMMGIQNEKGVQDFLSWWQADPFVPHVDENGDEDEQKEET